MKLAVAVLLLAACACAVEARSLLQNAATDPRLTTFNRALKAAGININDKAWTVFAPSNQAFMDDDLFKETGLTAQTLLAPANKAKLVQLLQAHVVPAGAVTSAQLNGKTLATALKGNSLMAMTDDDGQLEVSLGTDSAEVIAPNLKAGKATVHIIDDVLVPPSLLRLG